ncbi:MAG: relaxase/mobilization nuclease domain-containing protein [Bacteroidetes bacterium]|nr:relaxase/mobilization nuclease domain-containing protein [Bacteroidota bacterium]
MIVKFLYTKGPNGHFPAVRYNTGKVDRNKGELMKVANFGPLQGLGQLRPEDYRNYLKAVSSTNKAVKKPQFHVAISCVGKEYDKDQLTSIAVQWMEKMGYGQQPYLVIFHKDTRNHHVHIVSTRIAPDGKKISDKYEKIRGQQQMQVVLGIDPKRNAISDVEKALSYCFNTKAQFLMILESLGYRHKEENGKLLLFKFGKQQGEVNISLIDQRLGNRPGEDRRKQITAWFHKYAGSYDTTLQKNHGKYQSEFSAWLKQQMGIELVFHASGDKPPYGYTVIDHAEHNVFKGGEIVPLKELQGITKNETAKEVVPEQTVQDPISNLDDKHRQYYAAILKAVLYNYPDMVQGLYHHGLTLTRNGEDFYLDDPGAGISIPADQLLDETDYSRMVEQFSQSAEVDEEVFRQHIYVPAVTITDDIDDEAIHGRNRRRKKTTRSSHIKR